MMNSKVLILSDQYVSAEVWAHALRRQGLAVDIFELGTKQWQAELIATYDLCVIDINEHDDEAVTLCRSVRAATDNPLIVLTYEQDERTHLKLYEQGIDECVIKPLGPVLLIAKLMAWLRRSNVDCEPPVALDYKDFRLDSEARQLTTPDGTGIKLSHLESRLVFILLSNRGRAVPSETIVAHVWDGYGAGDSALLKRLVYRLRQKLEPDPHYPCYIESIPGIGYKFVQGN